MSIQDDLDAVDAEVKTEGERHALLGRLAAAMRQAASMEPPWTDQDWWLETERYRKQHPELVRRNRRLFAERQRWPDGVLAMCELLDARHAGWTVHWRGYLNIPGWYHPAGFVAWRESSGYVCGSDPTRLYQAMLAAPERRDSHYYGRCCALMRTSEGADVLLIAAALGYDV